MNNHRGRADKLALDKLEADLWTWRTKCKQSGKKIPKRLVQARAKWAFQNHGLSEFKASDGWYWKWLSKWKKRSKLSELEEETTSLTEEASNSPLQMDCEQLEDADKMIATSFWLPTHQEDEEEEDLLKTLSSHLLSPTDILPLVMNDGEVSLDPHPSQSTLPISPIFVCSSDAAGEDLNRNNKKTLHDLMPVDLAAVEATVNEVQDLDALLAEVTKSTMMEEPVEKDTDLTLTASNKALWPAKEGEPSRSPSVCSNNWSPAESLKENYEPDEASSTSSSPKKQLTVIAKHRRLGEESLNKLKEEVRKYALDHTFKETAKKFGIHHSTVSGWVKARERIATQRSLLRSMDTMTFTEKADEVFINWLKRNREAQVSITLAKVKDKVSELFQTYGLSNIEKTCKWFLLWHNRREEKQYVEGMEDEEVCRRETPNLAYPPAFKLEVALHAQKYSQYAAAKIFSVARRRIFDWMRQIPKLQDLIAKGHMKKMTGRGPKNRDIDQALFDWYSQRRAAGERPRSCEVQARAREIYTARGYTDMKCSYGWFKRWSQRFHIQLRYSYDDDLLEWILARFDANASVNHHDLQTHGLKLVRKEDPHFKASSGWALRFCKRHADYLNPDFSIGAKLPEHLEERANRFKLVLQQLIKEKCFGSSEIGCMDELPLILTPALRDKRIGSAAPGGILLKHQGLKCAQAVVILAATANGKLLPPFLVLKGTASESRNLFNLPECEVIVMITTDNDCTEVLNERIMNQWLNLVWFTNVSNSSLLIADSFQTHTNSVSQKLMVSRGGCLAIIPSACSQKLQPLHRGTKLKFKEFVECMYLKSLDTTSDAKPTNADIVSWVDHAYKMLKHQKDDLEQSFHETEILTDNH